MRALVCLAIAACGTSPATPDALPSAPTALAHYGFDGGSLASEPAGNTGTCAACAAVAAGLRGDGLAFTGVEEIALPPALIGSGAYTISIWVRPMTIAGSIVPLSKPLATDSTQDEIAIRLDPTGKYAFETAANSAALNLEPAFGKDVFDGDWHQLVASWDGAVKAAYIDGEIYAGGQATTPARGTQPILLGDDRDIGSVVFAYQGLLDELDFFDRALAPDEVARLAIP